MTRKRTSIRRTAQVEPMESRVLFSGYTAVDLGTLAGDFTAAIGVNDRAQAAGLASTASGDVHAFIWQNGQMVDTNTLGGDFSEAILINNQGQAVGDGTTASGEHHLAVWQLQNGKVRTTDLGMLPDSTDMFGNAINDRGIVVGEADFPDGSAHIDLESDGDLLSSLASGRYNHGHHHYPPIRI